MSGKGYQDGSHDKIDNKNDTYYRHAIEGCPDMAKSVFLTLTAEDSWNPYEVFCLRNIGKFTHKDLFANDWLSGSCKLKSPL